MVLERQARRAYKRLPAGRTGQMHLGHCERGWAGCAVYGRPIAMRYHKWIEATEEGSD